MLQKLENLYLAILRVAVMVLCGLLLAGVIVLGAGSFRALQPVAQEKPAAPPVAYESLKNSILMKDAAGASSAGIAVAARQADPNQPHYDRVAEAIAVFITHASGGAEVPDKAKLAEITRDVAQKYQDPDVVAAFARSYADAAWTLLQDPAVIASAKGTPPVDLVNRMLTTFTRQFEQHAGTVKAQVKARQEESSRRQAEARQNLYVAGGAFVAFLMAACLSVLIRMERQLRHLEEPED